MSEKKPVKQAPAAPGTEDILDRQYQAIGIGAVAAACRYLRDPEPLTSAPGRDPKAH